MEAIGEEHALVAVGALPPLGPAQPFACRQPAALRSRQECRTPPNIWARTLEERSTAMDLLAIVLSCSMYFDDDLVRAIAQSTSHSNEYFVTDIRIEMTALDPPEPHSLEAAMARVDEITSRGGHPVLGLMQLPPAWIDSFGRTNRDAFDACTNVAIGTAMLSQFDYECGVPSPAGADPTERQRRACVIRKYGEASGVPDFVTVTNLELRFQRPAALAEHVLDTPILFVGATERGSEADRIFVPIDHPP